MLSVWLSCAAAALLVARHSPRRRPPLGWFLALGPFGLVLTAYGVQRDRALLRRPPAPGALAAGINVPCEALVDGTWQQGRLLSFRTLDEHWQGYVAVPDRTATPTWFDRDHLRPAS